jgi:hypothetical protein
MGSGDSVTIRVYVDSVKVTETTYSDAQSEPMILINLHIPSDTIKITIEGTSGLSVNYKII